MITLTLLQIIELAEFAGLSATQASDFDAMELETEFTITDCPPDGLRNEGEESDQGSVSHYSYIVYCTDCPDEGCIGLGPEISVAQVRSGST